MTRSSRPSAAPPFRGVLTALVTPLRDDTVDVDALRALCEWQLASGVHGLVPCGTTGEASTLTTAEWELVARTVVDTVRRRVPVVVGCGTNDTRVTAERAARAVELGADGLLVVTPYYNRPGPDGLVAHYAAVVKAATGAPVLAYNVPSRTGVTLAPATVARLVAEAGIAGIKEATADLRLAAELLEALPEGRRDGFSLLSGDDFTMLPLWALGGDGVICTTSNVAPAECAALWNRWSAGDVAGARALHYRLLPLMRALFVESNPIPVKAAVDRLGRGAGAPRLPMTPAQGSTRERLEAAMRSAGVLAK